MRASLQPAAKATGLSTLNGMCILHVDGGIVFFAVSGDLPESG